MLDYIRVTPPVVPHISAIAKFRNSWLTEIGGRKPSLVVKMVVSFKVPDVLWWSRWGFVGMDRAGDTTANRDLLSLSAKPRILQLRSRPPVCITTLMIYLYLMGVRPISVHLMGRCHRRVSHGRVSDGRASISQACISRACIS
jgi:hypothetical protein